MLLWLKKIDHGEKTSPSVDAYGRVGYSSLDEVQTNQGDMHYMITWSLKEMANSGLLISTYTWAQTLATYRWSIAQKHPRNRLLSVFLSKDVESISVRALVYRDAWLASWHWYSPWCDVYIRNNCNFCSLWMDQGFPWERRSYLAFT